MLILTKKDQQDRTKNAKVERFQNFPNFGETFTQFQGTAVCWGKNYGIKKFSNKSLGGFFWGIFLFFENIFGDHFHISQFVPI